MPHNRTLQRVLLLLSTCSIMFLINLDITAVMLSLKDISTELNFTGQNTHWIISSYMLTAGPGMLLSGRLGDRYGYKRLFFIGLAGFAISSLLIALSTTMLGFIISRCLQGFSMALAYPQILILATVGTEQSHKNKILAIVTATACFAQASGPMIGASIVAFSHWNYIFLINLPIVAVSAILGLISMKHQIQPTSKEPFNFVVPLCITLAITLVMYLTNLHTRVSALTLGSLLLIGIVYLGQRCHFQSTRFLQNLLRDRFTRITLSRILFMIPYSALMYTIVYYYQTVNHMSVLTSGIEVIYLTIPLGIFSLLASYLPNRNQTFKQLSIYNLISGLLYSLFAFALPFHIGVLHFLLIGIGACVGLLMTYSTVGAIAEANQNAEGKNIGMFFSVVYLCIALGVFLANNLVHALSSPMLGIKFTLLLCGLSSLLAGLSTIKPITTNSSTVESLT